MGDEITADWLKTVNGFHGYPGDSVLHGYFRFGVGGTVELFATGSVQVNGTFVEVKTRAGLTRLLAALAGDAGAAALSLHFDPARDRPARYSDRL